MNISFNKPYLAGNELTYMAEAVRNSHISGDGSFTRRCHTLLEEQLDVHRSLLTTSCTHALEMAAILLNIQPGDEVIVPSFTFVSTVNAFVLRGAKPVFCDIRPDTLNMDESLLPRMFSPRTRAIVPVHYGGVGCEMDSIMALAEQHRLAVVEDNAHGRFGRYRGKLLGTFGDMPTLASTLITAKETFPATLRCCMTMKYMILPLSSANSVPPEGMHGGTTVDD